MNITREDHQRLLNPQFTPAQLARRAELHARAQQANVNFTPLHAQAQQTHTQGKQR